MSARRPAFLALFAALGALALLSTAELLLRATPLGPGGEGQRSLHRLRLDRPWLFGLRPGLRTTVRATGDVAYEINADGFRDRPFPREVPARHFRVLALGASITFGWGVSASEIYPERLEQLLAGRAETTVDVLNLGVNGYNAYNQAALLADVGVAYEPDLVLVEFCVAGLQDPALHFDVQTRLHRGMIPEQALPDPSMRREPTRFAGFVRLCRRLRTCAVLDDAFLGLTEEETDPAELIVALRPRELPPGPTRDWLEARYVEMARAAASTGAAFAVIAFPYRSQVHGSDSGRLQQQVVELAREHAWPALDLLAAFRRAAQAGAPALFIDAWHPSAAGHDVAARAIAEWLASQDLPPARPRVSAAGTRRAPPEASR